MLSKPIIKAQKKIEDIERQYSIESLKENYNKYINIERRIKRGEKDLSNDDLKPLYLTYRMYLKAIAKVKKFDKEHNIVSTTEHGSSPTAIVSLQSSTQSIDSRSLTSFSLGSSTSRKSTTSNENNESSTFSHNSSTEDSNSDTSNDIVDSFSNRHQKLSSIRRRLFTQRSSRRTFIGGNCTYIMS